MLARIGPEHAGTVRTIGITTRANWRPTARQQRLIDLIHSPSSETRLPENR